MSIFSRVRAVTSHIKSSTKKASMGDAKETSPPPAHSDSFIGSIDQGTTSTRFLIFNRDGEPVASHQIEFKQYYPQSG